MATTPDKEKKKKQGQSRALQPIAEKMGLGEQTEENAGQRPMQLVDPQTAAGQLLPSDVAPMTLGKNTDVQDDMARRFRHRQGQGGTR